MKGDGKVREMGFCQKTSPFFVIVGGDDANAPDVLGEKGGGEEKIFPCGATLFLQNQPFFLDAHCHEAALHGFGLTFPFAEDLATEEEAGGLFLFFQKAKGQFHTPLHGLAGKGAVVSGAEEKKDLRLFRILVFRKKKKEEKEEPEKKEGDQKKP